MTYPTYPINAIVQTRQWHNSILRFTLPSDTSFKRAINNLQSQIAKWTIDEFLDLYSDSEPIWSAVNQQLLDYYYSPEKSVEIIEELIKFQLRLTDEEDADLVPAFTREFLKDVFNIMERRLPKTNSISIISPPSGGKNFFFDMILSFYLNTGNIQNFTKNNAIPFQDCIYRRALLWNEINFMPSALDTVKMITAGDSMHVNIKYESHVPIYRTPVIILSNVDMLTNAAFRDRVIKFNWLAAPFLKNYNKKPHPLAYPLLLKKYNVTTFKQEYECLK